jgi:hypothetical protein
MWPFPAKSQRAGRYVTAMHADWDWVLMAETEIPSDWEKFTLVSLP